MKLLRFMFGLAVLAYGQSAVPQAPVPALASAAVPFYPRLAQQARIQGVVTLHLSTDGKRVSAIEGESGPLMLVKAAKENVSVVGGGVEALAGGAVQGGGVAACGTGVGCLAGAPAIAGGTVMEVHGAAMAGSGLIHLAKSASETGSTTTDTDSKPHGNTAGNQPAELYEKYDAQGNFEKHGVSQDSNKRYTKKEINGGRVDVVDKGPRREMLNKERQRVETNPGPKNRERWAGKRKEQQ